MTFLFLICPFSMNEWVMLFFLKYVQKRSCYTPIFPIKATSLPEPFSFDREWFFEERFSCAFEHTQCGKCITLAPTFHQIYTVGEWIYNYLQIYSSGKTWQKKKYIYIYIYIYKTHLFWSHFLLQLTQKNVRNCLVVIKREKRDICSWNCECVRL